MKSSKPTRVVKLPVATRAIDDSYSFNLWLDKQKEELAQSGANIFLTNVLMKESIRQRQLRLLRTDPRENLC